jgi:MFS family permease
MPRVPTRSPLELTASPDAVRAAAERALGAQPGGDGALMIEPAPERQPAFTQTLRVVPGPNGGSTVEAGAEGGVDIPFFGWFFVPLVAIARRRAVTHTLDALRAALDGTPAPKPPGPIFGLPPVAFTHEQATLLATASAATAVVSFAGALFGQLNGPISDSFGASDARISVALALTRVGALLALIPTALADRRGRRWSILIGVGGSAAACLISSISPGLAVFTGAQIFQRGFVITTFTVAGIAVIEEAPEGARAYAASMLALAGGFGFSLSVVVLPLGDAGANGWRVPFLIGAASIFLARPISSRLAETTRYANVAARQDVERGRLREIVDKRFRRRFLLLGAAAFLTSVFSAPSSQLMNKYLEDVRGFSSTGIAVFRTVTTAVPGLIGLILGGRLAEVRGRRMVAAIGLAIATATQMVFFLTGGSIIWVMSAVSILTAGAGGIALGTLDVELFATEVRSTSNALLTILGVTGSVLGLITAGLLADPLGNLGRSIALTGVAALLAAALVVPRLPETRDLALDDVSPTEAGSDP